MRGLSEMSSKGDGWTRLRSVVITVLMLSSCMTGKPLSEAESMVTVFKAGQETTLRLYDTCKAYGKAEMLTLRGRQDSDDEFKRRAAANGVNVVQILYGEPDDLHHINWNYYVRYWSCP